MDFTPYTPSGASRPRAEVRVRPAVPADVPRCAALLAAYDGRPDAEHQQRLRRRLRAPRGCVLVAELGDDTRRIVGCGRVAWLEPDGCGAAPAGHYLVGLVVDPAHRRSGIGEALTRARIAWALAHGPEVWYFANARNRASLDLHARLGFAEVTRDFTIPGVTFEGGEGVLARATAESVAAAAGGR
jgi:GNAT superfamily N-acetyltransferase